MFRFVADENFNNRILKAIRRHLPELDVVRIQDMIGSGVDDPAVLAWAAVNERLLLTHDVRTMPDFAYARVRSGLRMPGVIEVDDTTPMSQIIEAVALVAYASQPNEFEGQVIYLPFR